MFTDYTAAAEITAEGKLELLDSRAFAGAMRQFKRGRATVRVEVDRGKRSTQQNRYYRLVLGLISDDTGDEPEDLHEFFKKKFNPVEFSFGAESDVIGGSTTRLDYDAFWDYVEKIRRFALAERGIVTPDPDPEMRGRSRRAKRRAS